MRAALRLGLVAVVAVAAVGVASPPSGGQLDIQVTRRDDPEPDGCDPGVDCSLREAVMLANSTPEPDRIALDRGTYTLTLVAHGDLGISEAVVIKGRGRGKTTIDASALDDRAFDVEAGARLALQRLTVTGGEGGAEGGGAVRNRGIFSITNGALTGNRAEVGGGVLNTGAAESFTAESSRIANNKVGGGVVSEAGIGFVNRSTIANNEGGGLVARGTTETAVTRSTLSGNSTSGNGGGLSVQGDAVVAVKESTINGNSADGDGGGVYAGDMAEVRITRSTLSGNKADGNGGGLLSSSLNVAVSSTTIANNRADFDGAGGGTGGGLHDAAGPVNLKTSILAGNTVGGALNQCSGMPKSLGWNLVQGALPGDCAFASLGSDRIGVNPNLRPLANNGGRTRTHAIPKGSPARNKAPRGECSPADQRGAPRKGKCDIGAYEYVACKGVVVNRVGTDRSDVLRGTGKRDGILGLKGDDTIRAKRGADRVCAGPGNDTVVGGPGNDRLFGQQQNDLLKGGPGNDLLKGGPGVDTCRQGAGRGRLIGCER